MSQQQVWTAVDSYFNDRLAGSDAALTGALEASDAASLPAIQISPTQGKFLLILEVFLRILGRAIKALLLGLDILHQLVTRGFVQFVLLSAELLLETVDLIGLGLELVLFRLKLLG